MRALVQTALGRVLVDLDEDELVEITDDPPLEAPEVRVDLPLVLAADRHGSTVIAVVDRRPPLVVSHDAGVTWTEAGAGLPAGRALAISPEHPDVVLFASNSRLYVSEDGGRFWRALTLELPSITTVAWIES